MHIAKHRRGQSDKRQLEWIGRSCGALWLMLRRAKCAFVKIAMLKTNDIFELVEETHSESFMQLAHRGAASTVSRAESTMSKSAVA